MLNMKPENRIKLLTFFSVFLLAFGITALNFDNLVFEENQKSYITIALGLTLAIMIFWSKLKK
ncbi:MAG: hypothetical protein DWP98_11990 [Bacteroidetes bacterium]|nr:MAG: hypothetical protein DWP98_11990 [Bacteroidota bacterium]MBL1144251.1 hypothetical protein [Bacteroidota bacterium]